MRTYLKALESETSLFDGAYEDFMDRLRSAKESEVTEVFCDSLNKIFAIYCNACMKAEFEKEYTEKVALKYYETKKKILSLIKADFDI